MKNEDLIKILRSYPPDLDCYISDMYNEPEKIDEILIKNIYGKEVITIHANC